MINKNKHLKKKYIINKFNLIKWIDFYELNISFQYK